MTTEGSTIYLVSCVSSKNDKPCAAKDLYISDWFLKARAVVESTRLPWFILSANYGMLTPEQVVEPYNKTLNTMSVANRRTWSERTCRQLMDEAPYVEHVVFFAGKRYREFLVPHLDELEVKTTVPMEGLTIGQQLKWLKSYTPESQV